MMKKQVCKLRQQSAIRFQNYVRNFKASKPNPFFWEFSTIAKEETLEK
jgi:hypothetical protein